MRELSRRGRTEADWLRSRRACADVGVFQQFFAPPYGGGNQFLLALVGELRRRSLTVEVNRLSGGTPACLYNSFNFDFSRLRRFARDEARMVHRVDGPIGAYRGFDDGTDRRIIEINRELADATIVQSQFSLEKHRERVIATSWSDNPRKGGEVLEWLDRNLDTDSFEFTFAGRTQRKFERIRVVQPIPSEPLADLLRSHDVYLAPSRDDPCSNALLEALACGLPAAFLRSGGHPELVGEGGIGFGGASRGLRATAERARPTA
jgi:hypothetical protein